MKNKTEIYSFVFFRSVNKIKENFIFYIGLSLMLLLFYGIYYMIDSIITNSDNPNILLGMIINFFVILIQIGLIKVILNISFSREHDYLQLFTNVHYFFNYFFASFVYVIIVFAGLLLLIIPGIICAILLLFYPYLIIESEKGIIESLRYSLKMTKEYIWQVFIIWLIINTIHIILYVINYWLIIIIIPFTTTLLVHTFIYLQGEYGLKILKEKIEQAKGENNEEV